MAAIMVKELREGALCALLLMLGLAVALAYGTHSDAATAGIPFVSTLSAVMTGVGYPFAGLTLGLLQVMQDRWRRQWSFVAHRPVSRSTLFTAKVIAGAALYTVAGGLPLAVTVAWVATPGHVAGPFDWRMAMAPLADFAGGLLWYATGLLIAARQARWVGTRLMPVAVALLVYSFAWGIPFHLWQAMLLYLLGITIVLPGAWAAFVAGDDYDQQPLWCRGLQALCLTTGLALVIGLGTVLTVSGIEWVRPSARSGYQTYWIDREGRVVRSTSDGTGVVTETDLDGRPVHLDDVPAGRVAMRTGMIMLGGFPSEGNPWQRKYDQGLHQPTAYVQRLGVTGDARWFYVVSRRTIEGYDLRTGRLIGSIGPDGFAFASVRPRPFPEPLYQNLYNYAPTLLACPSAVYRVELGQGIHKVWSAASGDPVVECPTMFPDYGDGMSPWYTAVLTRSGVHVIRNGRPVFSLPLRHAAVTLETFSIGRATDGRFVLWYGDGLNGRDRVPEQVVVVGPDGQLVSRTDLPLLPPPTSGEPAWVDPVEMAAMPPALFAIMSVLDDDAPRAASTAMVVGMGVLSALLAVLLGKRYALGRRAIGGWATFALLTGIGGLLALPAMRPLPPRVACPGCGRRRVVTLERCEHCDAPFAEPAMEGIEVFQLA